MVLREAETDDEPVEVHLVTASPFEAQDYMDSSEETVERVAMPEPLIEMIAAFIKEHHVEEDVPQAQARRGRSQPKKNSARSRSSPRAQRMTNGHDNDE